MIIWRCSLQPSAALGATTTLDLLACVAVLLGVGRRAARDGRKTVIRAGPMTVELRPFNSQGAKKYQLLPCHDASKQLVPVAIIGIRFAHPLTPALSCCESWRTLGVNGRGGVRRQRAMVSLCLFVGKAPRRSTADSDIVIRGARWIVIVCLCQFF